jgi:hypothetical protein
MGDDKGDAKIAKMVHPRPYDAEGPVARGAYRLRSFG